MQGLYWPANKEREYNPFSKAMKPCDEMMFLAFKQDALVLSTDSQQLGFQLMPNPCTSIGTLVKKPLFQEGFTSSQTSCYQPATLAC